MEAEKAESRGPLKWQGLLHDKAAGVSFVAVNNPALASKLGMKRTNEAAECYALTESQYLHEHMQEVNTYQSS